MTCIFIVHLLNPPRAGFFMPAIRGRHPEGQLKLLKIVPDNFLCLRKDGMPKRARDGGSAMSEDTEIENI